MIKIAICDDSPYELNMVSKKISSYIKHWHSVDRPELLAFSSGKNLIAEIESGRTLDIFILDIDMPEMNGFQLVEEMRKFIPAPLIIFLTSHINYASKAFRFRAFRYILKLNLEEELSEALDSAVSELKIIEDRSVTITHYNECYRVPYSDIMCVQLDGRQLNVMTKSAGIIFDSRSVQDFFKTLDDRRFVLVDRGCIVNIDYIQRITGMEVILTTNQRFTISRRMLKELKLTLTKEWNL